MALLDLLYRLLLVSVPTFEPRNSEFKSRSAADSTVTSGDDDDDDDDGDDDNGNTACPIYNL
jgi:hypothetical protein